MLRFSYSLRLAIALLLLAFASGCSGANPLALLTSDGPNVAANVQGGRTNLQTVGTSDITEVRVEDSGKVDISEQAVKADKIDNVTVNETPAWIILTLALLAGLIIPSPIPWRKLFNRTEK